MWKKIGKSALDIIKGIAPVAASAFGGPFAGAAMSIIAKQLGVKENEVEDYVLSANPDQLLQLKQAEIEFERWREEAGIRREELIVEDRKDARTLAKEKGVMVQAILSAAYTIGYFGTLWTVMNGGINVDPEYNGLVQTLLGALGAAQLQVLNFWFGSSRGSAEKTQILANGKGNS